MLTKHCTVCGVGFESQTPWHRYCGAACSAKAHRARIGLAKHRPRHCRQCGSQFFLTGRGGGNQAHCSTACSAKSARESRYGFYKKNPHKEAEYRAASRERAKASGTKDRSLTRLCKRCPGTPVACQSCGESRVVQIAHKPEHRRLGAWQSSKNTRWPETVWILCPTCHILLDQCGYTPAQLGLA